MSRCKSLTKPPKTRSKIEGSEQTRKARQMITHARFAAMASHLAGRVSSWAGDTLTLPEQVSEPMRDDSIERHLKMVREYADYIEEMHREETLNK